MLSAILRARKVTHQLIISSVNLYLILGMFYAHIYTVLEWFHPEFVRLAGSEAGIGLTFRVFQFRYFGYTGIWRYHAKDGVRPKAGHY